MGKVMETMRRVVGSSATAPAGSAPIDLKAQYIHAVSEFIASGRRYNRQGEVHHWQSRLHAIHHRAQEDGHGDAMNAVWVEPPAHVNAEILNWYESATSYALRGGTEPGDRPFHPYEPEHWFPRYNVLVADFLRAHRSGDRAATGHAANLLAQFPRLASVSLGDKTGKVLPHFGPLPGFLTDEASLVAWQEEVAYRLENGAASGRYVPPQMPAPFRRMIDVWDHSAIVLLAPHGPDPLGARVLLGPDVSHELVELGRATWCDPGNIPVDPRPPVECEPETDWLKVTFLRQVRTRSRHMRQASDVVALPPDEADELVLLGKAEFWTAPLPPPPAPPRVVTVFGDAAA